MSPKPRSLALPETEKMTPVVQSPATPMEMLQHALQSGASLEMMEKLIGLQERWMAGQARRAFDEAIAAAKAEIPVIAKDRKVGFESKKPGAAATSYKHESLGEIARTIDPILAKHGLSYRWRSSQGDGGISVTCVLSHKDGHFEETTLRGGADSSGNKNPLQAVASTTTYLSRYTLKLALGLATAEGDDDGQSAHPSAKITEEQVNELIALADETSADKSKICKWLGVESVPEIPAAAFEKAKNALLDRRRQTVESV